MGKVHTRCSERKNKRRRTTQRNEKRKGEEDRLQPHIHRHATCLVRKREVDWIVRCVCGVLIYRKAKATLWCENDLCTRLKSTHDSDFVFVTSFSQYLVLFKGLSPTVTYTLSSLKGKILIQTEILELQNEVMVAIKALFFSFFLRDIMWACPIFAHFNRFSAFVFLCGRK